MLICGMKVLLQEPQAQVFYSQQNAFIEIRIQSGISLKDYKFAYEHALQAAKNQKIRRFLINERQHQSAGYAHRTWFSLQFLPKFFRQLGLHVRLAVVRKPNSVTNLSTAMLEAAQQKLAAKFQLAFFDDDQAAADWLSQPPEHTTEIPPED